MLSQGGERGQKKIKLTSSTSHPSIHPRLTAMVDEMEPRINFAVCSLVLVQFSGWWGGGRAKKPQKSETWKLRPMLKFSSLALFEGGFWPRMMNFMTPSHHLVSNGWTLHILWTSTEWMMMIPLALLLRLMIMRLLRYGSLVVFLAHSKLLPFTADESKVFPLKSGREPKERWWGEKWEVGRQDNR